MLAKLAIFLRFITYFLYICSENFNYGVSFIKFYKFT